MLHFLLHLNCVIHISFLVKATNSDHLQEVNFEIKRSCVVLKRLDFSKEIICSDLVNNYNINTTESLSLDASATKSTADKLEIFSDSQMPVKRVQIHQNSKFPQSNLSLDLSSVGE